ncbi:MAG: PhnD/SsuA/transferrin family substrate-binding protein [Pontiellaceae bacterium]|nr:PhnD/SsuA/transferrin family substrate-binding protein [Pontiellaceae bacterium]MBN2786635.1 PhnD/SsuA/transferrin family substrate-binding protein [Pontiellaceae bacterium]
MIDGANVIRYGYSMDLFAGVNETDALAAFTVWGESVLDYYGLEGTLEPVELTGFEMTRDALRENRIDIVVIQPNEFFEMKDELDPTRLYCVESADGVGVQFLLLVRADSGIDELGDLKGGRFSGLDGGRTGGMADIWLNTMLMDRGYGMEKAFFADTVHSSNNSRTILDVFFGKRDACIVSASSFETMVELNPQVGRKLKILAESPRVIDVLLCVDKEYSQVHSGHLFDALEVMHETVSGRQILMVLKSEKLRKVSQEALEKTEEWCIRYMQLMEARENKGEALP